MILVAVSLDPHHAQEATFELPLWEWKLPDHGSLLVEDLMRGQRFVWTGKLQHIRLDPRDLPFAIWRLAPPARRAMNAPQARIIAATADDPLWYKDAIIYQLHVKSFFDSNNDGIGDFAGLMREARLHRRARRQHDLAAAVLSLAAPRRRLRHRRLPRRPSRLRHDDRREALHRGRARARHPRHHRAGHQPHLRPASLVPARARAPSPARRRATSMSGPTPTRNIPARASSSSTPSSRTGPGTRSRAPISGTASIRTSPISTSTIRACSRRCSA